MNVSKGKSSLLDDPWQLPPRELIGRYTDAYRNCLMLSSKIRPIAPFAPPFQPSDLPYLEGILLARLEGLKPSFNAGDKVKPKGEKRAIFSLNGHHRIPGDKTQVVWRVHYRDNKWCLSLEDVLGGAEIEILFKAEDFCLVDSSENF